MCEKDITLNIDNPSSYFITRIRFLLYKKPKDIVRLQHFTNDGKCSELIRLNKMVLFLLMEIIPAVIHLDSMMLL